MLGMLWEIAMSKIGLVMTKVTYSSASSFEDWLTTPVGMVVSGVVAFIALITAFVVWAESVTCG